MSAAFRTAPGMYVPNKHCIIIIPSEYILYIGCQAVISGIVSSFLGSSTDRLLVISAFSVSG